MMKLPRTAPGQVVRCIARHGQPASHNAALSLLRPSCLRVHRHVTPRSSAPTSRSYATVSASELQFGQPVHETHPHLLAPGELTPGITAQEYADRRAALSSLLPPDSVVILPAAELKYRSGAVFFPFRQESNFLYLTGFSEPESLAVIRTTSSAAPDNHTFHLLVRPKDPRLEQWSGPWSGTQAATDVWNADTSGSIHNLDTLLPSLIRGAKYIYTDAPLTQNSSPTPLSSLLRSSCPSASIRPLQPKINPLRAIKSPAEIALMRRAGRATGRAFTAAMRRPWPTEKSLAAFLDHEFVVQGADGQAYVPVVAGGPRGNMIHYVQNLAALSPRDTVLVDAGAELGGYISDVTRVWPVGGRFSDPQRDLYEAVLRVQRTGVAMCRAAAPGGVTLDQIHRVTERLLREQLDDLGFDTRGDAMGVLFPHHVGHYVGLDVHDVPGYGRDVKLSKGHCVTVEPGVYVPDDERWPEHFRGLAVRIEDSVCVDDEGPLVLTTEAVKEVVDIEALRE
ncbi:Aminopeptidase-like protein [Coniochaeta hoffmannii]|uniref:Xaa-Pro aminopeptidase n=1 Tax=Coniochaeta hoffmannii TaxID=91930 RepID=A0AA38VTP4_9PEZI|nr:Aminopeptidase-like protein [Coniochaeta hoffmannii]